MEVEKKISIIIPAFNVEKFIAKCLDSCLKQDLSKKDYEIIVVNDGSTDTTSSILEKYADSYKNIKVYSKKNEGPSVARNFGIQFAKGKFIWFVDADDFIKPNCLSEINHLVSENNLDVLWFDLERINESGEKIPIKKIARSGNTNVMSGPEFMNKVLGFNLYAVLFIINKDFLLNSKLKFYPGIYYEDAEFIPRLLIKAQRVKYVPNVFYYYLLRSDSIIQKPNPKKIDDLLIVIDSLKKTRNQNSDEAVILYLNQLLSKFLIGLIRFASNPVYKTKQKNLIEKIQELGIHKILVFGSIFQKIQGIIFNVSPSLFLFFCRIARIFQKIKKLSLENSSN